MYGTTDNSAINGKLYVNGVFQRTISQSGFIEIKFNKTGKNTIEVRKEGYVSYINEVQIQSGENYLDEEIHLNKISN
jgi:hypothetical protein